MTRTLYSLAWFLAIPLMLVYLLYRSIRQPEYRQHWPERFGIGRFASARQRPIWVHAVSVGETTAAAPLIRQLMARYPAAHLLLTHATPTGRATGESLFRDLGPRLRQAYLPYDLPPCVGRFLRTERPAFGLIMETEVWPNLMHATRSRGIAMAVVNARLSQKSLARGLRYRSLIRPAIEAFDLIVAQSMADSQRIARLGRQADAVVGNLKFDQPVSVDARTVGKRWRAALGEERAVVLAASTREGEEALLLASWRNQVGASIAAAGGQHVTAPLLVIVPRHPNRFDAVATLIASTLPEHRLMRREALDRMSAHLDECGVLLGDSMGEMQRWYACADVVVMGGSLLAYGSQNLIEANALGCPVVLGPSVYNFAQAAAESIAAGASLQVADVDAALTAALRIAGDVAERKAMSDAAIVFTQTHRGATSRTLRALEPLLQRCERDLD